MRWFWCRSTDGWELINLELVREIKINSDNSDQTDFVFGDGSKVIIVDRLDHIKPKLSPILGAGDIFGTDI